MKKCTIITSACNSMRIILLAGFFVIFSMGSIISPGRVESKETKLERKKGRIELRFGSIKDGFPLAGLHDNKARRELLLPDQPIWSIELENSNGKKQTLTNMQCRDVVIEQLLPTYAVITWTLDEMLQEEKPDDGSNQSIQVKCVVKVDETSARMKLRIYNNSTIWSIREIIFPDLRLVQLGKSDEDDMFVYPFVSGKLIRQPLKKNFNFSKIGWGTEEILYPNAQTDMQFCAYWDRAGGLYIATEDPLASTKYLRCRHEKEENSIVFKVVWPAPDAGVPGNDFEQSGYVVMELFDGDWFDAAQIYRRWASSEAYWWPPMGKEGRTDTPRWMKEIAVWVMDGPESVDETIEFAEFMGVPTAIHLYNWHQTSFDNDYPHYFPVKYGLKEGIKKLQEAGVRVMPYINARLWDSDTEDFNTFALPAATKNENGEYYYEVYGSSGKLVPMCPTTLLWHDTVKNIVLKIVGPELGADGVYLDQVAASPPRLCYDPSHGHPLGGGHWWTTDGYWPMLERLQSTLATSYPDKILTTECTAEPYTHVFDGYLTWHFQYSDAIPLFSAVYGGVLQQFGRSYSEFGRQYSGNTLAQCMKIGQSLVFGEQLGWIAADSIKDKEMAEYLRAAAQVRYNLLPFLSWGRMVRPPELSGNIPDVTDDWGWGFGKHDEKMVTVSAIQRGAWQSHDGRIVFIFTNVSDKEVTFTWHFDPSRYGFGGKKVQLEVLESQSPVRTINKKADIPIILSSHHITTYMIKPVQ